MELDFERVFKISVYSLKLNRLVFYKRDLRWVTQVLIFYGIFLAIFVAILNSLIYYMKINQLSDACDNGAMAIAFVGVTLMYSIVSKRQKDLIYLINAVNKDYNDSKNMSDTEQSYILDYIKKGKSVMHIWSLITVFVVLLIPSRVIVVMVSKGKFRLVDILESFHPVILEKSSTELWCFNLELVIRVYYTIYANIMYIGFSPLGPIFMLHACGQLEIVKERIKSIFPEHNYDAEEAKQKLKDVVQRIQRIYDFLDSINRTCEVYYQIILNSISLLLPMIGYMLTKDFQSDKLVEYGVFLFGSFLMTFLPCYYSTLLLEKGEEVREAVYMSGWEGHMDSSARGTLLVILTRASRPMAVHTLFKTINLDALTDVCRTAYTIFNLLNTVWE
nr:odorant receptor 40 [Achelura yunnanensis]